MCLDPRILLSPKQTAVLPLRGGGGKECGYVWALPTWVLLCVTHLQVEATGLSGLLAPALV